MNNEGNDRRLLLINNSTLYGSGYLDHAEAEIRGFLGDLGQVLFIPFAFYNRDAYAATARDRFERMGYEIASIHSPRDAQQAVNDAKAIFIGGGNTLRLLKESTIRMFCKRSSSELQRACPTPSEERGEALMNTRTMLVILRYLSGHRA